MIQTTQAYITTKDQREKKCSGNGLNILVKKSDVAKDIKWFIPGELPDGTVHH